MPNFTSLPPEIHDCILDYTFGFRASLAPSVHRDSNGSGRVVSSTTGRWVRNVRHPRRKALSDLALVCPAWRRAVQERIYRHVVIKGTVDSLKEAEEFLEKRPYLASYIRHIEIWVPAWSARSILESFRYIAQVRNISREQLYIQSYGTPSRGSRIRGQPFGRNDQLALQRASLQIIFEFVHCYLPNARILSIEGGYCRRSRLIRHFDNDHNSSEFGTAQEGLSPLPQIHTLVLRGAWNIMRSYEHWQTISSALPNLHEAQITYAKPKPAGHATVARILSRLQPSIKNLDLCLEDFHCDWGYFRGVQFYSTGRFTRRTTGVGSLIRQFHGAPPPFDGQLVSLPDGNMIYRHQHLTQGTLPHLCRIIGAVVPRLEALSLTGRCCSRIFQIAADLLRQSRGEGELRVLDLAVKGCCSHSERNKKPTGSEQQANPSQTQSADHAVPAIGNHNGVDFAHHPASSALDLNDPMPSVEQIMSPSGNHPFVGHIHSETSTPPNASLYDDNVDMNDDGSTDYELDPDLDEGDSEDDQPAPSSNAYNSAHGIPNTNFLRFIKSFEQLVLSVLSALDVFPQLETIRIRFIELDSVMGLTNPYFEVSNDLVQGVWSEQILYAMNKRRPQWQYVELSDEVPEVKLGSGAIVRDGEASGGRPKSIQIEAYEDIAKDLREQFYLTHHLW